jgi:hypothetical protein
MVFDHLIMHNYEIKLCDIMVSIWLKLAEQLFNHYSFIQIDNKLLTKLYIFI